MTDRVLGHGAKCCDDKQCETCKEVRPTKKKESNK